MIACITGCSRVCSAGGVKLIQSCRHFHAKYRDCAEIISLETNPAEELIILLLLISYQLTVVQVTAYLFTVFVSALLAVVSKTCGLMTLPMDWIFWNAE